jgi:acetoin:2,6-dichlorophenolindophenol oxidoreductase subunit alpha
MTQHTTKTFEIGLDMTREALYRTMKLIRRFEEQVVVLVNQNLIPGVTHEYIGEEAVAAGVCSTLTKDDIITSTHRGHGHLLAKGAEPRRMMAELFARSTGLNGGRAGSMHAADLSLGIYGANGIVAAGTPFAVGAAWVAKQDHLDRVSVAFFGDGGFNQGILQEAMNMAGIWNLPVIFVCENNGYAITMATTNATAGVIIDRARAYGFPATTVDGMDAEVVCAATDAAVRRARAGEGPSFLECQTYRFAGHHTAERTMRLSYRSDEEIQKWQERDPVELVGRRLPGAVRSRIDQEVEEVLDEAIEFAAASPEVDPKHALDCVYATGLKPRDRVPN